MALCPERAQPSLRQQLNELVLSLNSHNSGRRRYLRSEVQEFGDFIHANITVRVLADLMIREARRSPQDEADLIAPIRDTTHLLELIDEVIDLAPPWIDEQGSDSLIGCPLNLLFSRLMSTPSGWSFFSRSDVNEHLRALLNAWSRFLDTSDSTLVLSGDNGWCKPKNLAELATIANTSSEPRTFQDIFVCPDVTNTSTLGYSSWDSFFLREFQPGQRPVGAALVDMRQQQSRPWSSRRQPVWPSSGNSLLNLINPCESTPLRFASNVDQSDTFWLKHQPYSLHDMLAGHWSTARFASGTVYQAFLSSFVYHRWHAPVSGRVVSILEIAGTYFSQLPTHAGLDPAAPPESVLTPYSSRASSDDNSIVLVSEDKQGDLIIEEDAFSDSELSHSRHSDSSAQPEHEPLNCSQPYLTAVATRMLILFEADCPAIGLVGFLAIGMAEVSSCQASVRQGQHVEAGQQIGMFHYGGSSCCLLLERSAAEAMEWAADPVRDKGLTYRVNGLLARVRN